ncbi:MAG TPA: hypothetical protein VND70_07480 [Acidimicrobiales bacterium]|nr:hypothetical protein [Acidimicrobiales bacterium]
MAIVALAALCTTGVRAAAAAPLASAASRQVSDSVPGIPGLPTGVPAAATAPVPSLPVPSATAWPFPSDFSHTDGTGRLAGGASLWTDFLYDDHGPAGSPVGVVESLGDSGLTPVHGGFSYPTGPADGNGADIFAAAVGYTPSATYWRVDWNTLVNADVPIAEWTFSTPAPLPAAGTAWRANAGLSSAGIQYALVVSAQSAQLLDAATGNPVAGANLQTMVDMSSRSFIVRIPTSVLPVSGTWTVRLAGGLANPAGSAFATVPSAEGGTGGTNAYNVTFRTSQQEAPLVCPANALPVPTIATLISTFLAGSAAMSGTIPVAECANFWMENDQADTLAAGNVSKYSLAVDWTQLAQQVTTPEPLPTGYSNRWYVSPLALGQGIVMPSSFTFTPPTYVSRIQSYAVYVPTTYQPGTPAPLTWILHSLDANLNQYGGLAPSQLQQECEARNSICATTEGFSEGGWYYAQSEVDFWDVWHQLALTYDLDPDATVISGYSMGGWASYKLGLQYPDLFAQAMPLEGPVICGDQATPGVGASAAGGQCSSDGQSTPLIVNAKWLPYVMTYGGADELVPITGGLAQAAEFQNLGYRYFAVLYPAEDHVLFAAQNDFAPATSRIGGLSRAINPGAFIFTWYPDLVSNQLGIGPTGDYWVNGLAARDTAPGTLATISASSAAIPDPYVIAARHIGVVASATPTPAATESQSWTPGTTPPAHQVLDIALTDVSAASVDTARAGLTCPAVHARTDGLTQLTLLGLAPGTAVFEGPTPVTTALASGLATVTLQSGSTNLQLCAATAGSGTSGSAGSGSGGATAAAPGSGAASRGTGTLAASGAPVAAELAVSLVLLLAGSLALVASTGSRRRSTGTTRR